MVSQDEFRERVLGFISDDFEAPSTITADIGRALRRDLTEAEVLEALLALARSGRAQAYLCNTDSREFIPVAADGVPRELLWFMARSTSPA